MSACPQPGCSGQIEDGYCDTCGLAPAPAATASAPSSPGTARPTASKPGTASLRVASKATTRSARTSRTTRSSSSKRGSSRLVGGSRPLARPPLPLLDPLAALVPGVVPERRRLCSSCDAQLKRDAGFCPKCGQEYSFIPTLQPGDVVNEKYEIKGTLAFGGLGWIYLALDVVLGRWVTLKGLLNSRDPKMLEVAVQEREFLAAVKHPNIVAIYDFITHGAEGFIVMEYVNGKTLMSLRKEQGGPLPVAEAISYTLEILPALGYLDEMGMVYCDYKPDNVMVEESSVKLIDLGAVRRFDDTGGDIYGSRGYTAPEASERPSHLSDLYCVARSLAVLVASFEFQGKHEYSLPPPSECDIFRKHPPLHDFLVKATRERPEARFQSAGEMGEQLLGVLRMILGPTPELGVHESSFFERDTIGQPDGASVDARLPRLKIDESDPAASVVLAAAALGDPARRRDFFSRSLKTTPTSFELKLRLLDEHLSLGEWAEAERRQVELEAASPGDWRLLWSRARAQLLQGKADLAIKTFGEVGTELPGELGPRLAQARSFEAAGDLTGASELYDLVSRTDPGIIAASFGLSACHELRRQRASAAAALARVPVASSRYTQAQARVARILINDTDQLPSPGDILQASHAIAALDGQLDALEQTLLRADLFAVAARVAADGQVASEPVLGVTFSAQALRQAAEQALRQASRMTDDLALRVLLVDEANQVRPFSLF